MAVFYPRVAFCRDITGSVVNQHSEPVKNADVCLMDSGRVKQTVITNESGAFRLTDVSDSCSSIIVTAEGFVTTQLKIKNDIDTVRVIINEKIHNLQEVVVKANTAFQNKNKLSFIPTKREKNISDGGINLLENMPIPTIFVDATSKAITTNLGDGVELFINGIPANKTEVENILTKNVLKVEYLEQPTDSRFNNARYVLNFVIINYTKGGYTRLGTQQAFSDWNSSYTGYSYFETKKMSYDIYGGYDSDLQKHIGERSVTKYDFSDFSAIRNENKLGKEKLESGFASFRIKYQSEMMSVANSFGMQINKMPYRTMSGKFIMYDGEKETCFFNETQEQERNHGLEWNGDYYFKLRNNFDFTSQLTASYMNTSRNYNYSATNGNFLTNIIGEKAWNAKLNATVRKHFSGYSLGMNIISSLNGNAIHYNGSSTDNVKVRDWYVMPRVVFNIKSEKLSISGNIGVSYEEATYNSIKETYFFPKTFISGNYFANNVSSINFSFEYSMFGNSLGMRSPNIIYKDDLTAIRGNSDLKNFHFISPSVSYNLLPRKNAIFNFFARWQYFEKPSVFSWNLEKNMQDHVYVVRSYANIGYMSHFKFGGSGTMRFFDNDLMLKCTVTQNFYNQDGLTNVNICPISISCQINYYLKKIVLSAFWEKSSKSASIFEVKRLPQNYYISLSYGHKNIKASIQCRNFFNSSWSSYEKDYNSPEVYYDIQNFGNRYHRAFMLSLSYSFSYGKKTRTNDQVGRSGIPNSAIVE